jgi:hypothetical protein
MVTEHPQSNGADDFDLVQQYQALVLEYEELDKQVDKLLAQHDGATENMSDEDYEQYRTLAYRRDDVYNQMKNLESQLFSDDAPDHNGKD